jgi:ATP-dependent DNA helicase UvrD/PcrA
MVAMTISSAEVVAPLSSLTDAQRAAVEHRGSPLLIIAGPGSGKTEVITDRVAWLVTNGHAVPDRMLVTTFTNKAALQLKDRIQKKLTAVNVELMQVSTMHSFCAELLRRFHAFTALGRDPQILDETGQLLFVFSRRKALGLDQLVKGRPHDFFEAVLRLFNLATEELVAPEKLQAWCEQQRESCTEDHRQLWDERLVVAAAYTSYCESLQEQGLVDFPFLQTHAVELLEGNANVLADARAAWPEILVDEYQDTNAAQNRILKLLAGTGEHLTVVGDDDQSIYRFRGATVRNIRDFTKDFPSARTITLEDNFRSRDPIIHHSARVIDHNPARFPKELRGHRGLGSDILVVCSPTARDEAFEVIDLLGDLRRVGKLRRWGDVAILLRSVRSYAQPYLEALQVNQIPHSVIGDASFFDRDEISQLYDLICFLAAGKPWGDKHVRSPIVGLSEQACETLAGYKEDLMEVATERKLVALGISDAGDREKLLSLLDLKREVHAHKQRSILAALHELLAISHCVSRFERAGDVEALANIGRLTQLFQAWDEWGTSSGLYPFLEYLKLLREGGEEPFRVPPEDAVQVMTIHQAKGLEFPVVVIAAAMQGRLPSARRADRYEVPFELRASGAPEVEDPHLVDERKLFYVAATRTRELLVIGTADVVAKRGGGPSQFIEEMFGRDPHEAAVLSRRFIAEALETAGRPAYEPRPRHSFSELAYFLQCPMRYKLRVVYGLQAPAGEAAGFGANVHRALEAIHRRAMAGDIVSPEDVEAIVEETWVPAPRQPAKIEQGVRKGAVTAVRRYVEREHEGLAGTVSAESAFSLALGEDILGGKIDLLRWKHGSTEVVDFKTAKKGKIAEKELELQADLYALGAQDGLAVKIAATTFEFLGDGKTSSMPWGQEREQAARHQLAVILADVRAGRFKANTAFCADCSEFNRICPYSTTQGGTS